MALVIHRDEVYGTCYWSIVVDRILGNEPGTNPASNTPRRIRQTTNPANDRVQPWQTVITPDNLLAARQKYRSRLHTPSEHDRTQPDRWTNFHQEDIGWHFEKDVGDEKHEQGNVEIRSIPSHVEIFFQTLQSGIADIDATKVVSNCFEGSHIRV